ncbi:MAG TPA: hypothetical protein VNM38_11845 [Solirubrobacterales bacterium]|nr:hypothetical protein [Solirubrobacterales bacterium]
MGISGDAFKETRALAVEAEEVAQRGLEAARGRYEADRQVCAAAAQYLGLTPAIMDVLVASGRDLAVAEARFGSAVESREALDKLIKELDDPLQG